MNRQPAFKHDFSRSRSLLLILALAPVAMAFSQGALAQQIQLQQIASGLSSPVGITPPGDGSGRLFITQQTGTIVIYNGGATLPTFLDVTSKIACCGERGLLGLAFHPGYASNGFFFIEYTATNGDLVVERYQRSANPLIADANSVKEIIRIPHPLTNHNGGNLAFGADGYLYMGTGDGGGGGDTDNRAQNLNDLMGKILRLDIDATGVSYAVPASNPFRGQSGKRGEIWAYGVRNPWRFSFDRVTRDLFIGDVGQGAREEIDFQPANSAGGTNYGWRLMEGFSCYNPSSNCNDGSLTLPILDYDHSLGIAVTGGYRYRGTASPDLDGIYFYGDYGSGRLWGATQGAGGTWSTTQLLSTGLSISSFGEDEQGEIYIVNLSGTVSRIVSAGIRISPDPIQVCDGSGLGTASLSWNFPQAQIVEIRLGSPSGPLFARSASAGSAATGRWVRNGTAFYAQDVTGGKALTAANTLGIVTAKVTCFQATPNPIQVCDGSGLGTTQLQWSFPTAGIVEVRLGSPGGPIFSRSGSSASATTGRWVRNGMTFYAQDVTGGKPLIAANTLGVLTVNVLCFSATPNPIQVCNGSGLGATSLQWNFPGVQAVEVRLAGPSGKLFARSGSTGVASTGSWVPNGLTFYAQNVSGGLPLTSANTLGTTTVTHTNQGCP
ncbi:MAG: PQQ-dependent sugar dehydrogenase [Acidobacteriota bacterium]